MKTFRPITLLAAVIATVAITSILRAQEPAPAEPLSPPTESQPDIKNELKNAERETLRKHYQAAVKDMYKAKDAYLDHKRSIYREDELLKRYIKSMRWVVQVDAQLREFEPRNKAKVAAFKKRLKETKIEDTIGADLSYIFQILSVPDKVYSPFDNSIHIVLMDTKNKTEVVKELHNTNLLEFLEFLAAQSRLELDIGEDVASLRIPQGSQVDKEQARPVDKGQTPPVDKELAFFERNFGKKIQGIKAKDEYEYPEDYYFEIAKQLGIAQIADEAAAAKNFWRKDSGKHTKSVVRIDQSRQAWYISIYRFSLFTEAKKPDPSTMQLHWIKVDFQGEVTFLPSPNVNFYSLIIEGY